VGSENDTLEKWRLNWDTLTWRKTSDNWFTQHRAMRQQRQHERKRIDRRAFGQETWGASKTHLRQTTREDVLKKYNLPVLRSELDLAHWLEISLPRLRWFTHDKAADAVWHYVKYTIPKRSGGQRVILAPKRELKALQRKILDEILAKVPASESAHGFITGRSVVTNARPHVGKEVVLNLDLKDFFPTVTFPRVRGIFLFLGYSFSVASVLALLCTEHDREAYNDGERACFVSIGPRALVQGAPTSPALANLAAYKLDRKLAALARRVKCVYTRYADDLTFSSDRFNTVLYLLDKATQIITEQGFTVNTKKTHIQRRSAAQRVTGIVVNDRANVPRKVRRQMRAILHNAGKTSLESQNRDGHEDFRAYLQGMIGFIHEANPEQAQPLKARLERL
jgi:retron-type reverse transcriptase